MEGGVTFQEGGQTFENSPLKIPPGQMGVPLSTPAQPTGAKYACSPSGPSGLERPPSQWVPGLTIQCLYHPRPYPVPCRFARRGQPVELDLPGACSLGIGVLWGTQVTVSVWDW